MGCYWKRGGVQGLGLLLQMLNQCHGALSFPSAALQCVRDLLFALCVLPGAVQVSHDVPNAALQVKYALISAQRCMICQGDICRYREQANDTANYGKARRYCAPHWSCSSSLCKGYISSYA